MTSVKAVANCLGINAGPNLSLLYHLYGFGRRRVPTDPEVTARVSLRQKVRDIQAKHIHLNVIRVGFDGIPAGGIDYAEEKLDYAIYRIANIYRPVGLGIGRVEHYVISTAQAGGSDDLGSEDEADELSDDWTVHNDATDVFVVRNISDSDFVGISPRPGSCDKDSKDDGLIGGEIGRDIEGVARTFAHENGHFLNLKHNHDSDECPATTAGKNNLMAQTKCALSVRNSVLLTASQGGTMLTRCSVKAGC